MVPFAKSWFSSFLPLTLLVACHTTGRTSEHDTGDPALLRYVDEEGRTAVAEARRVRDEAADAIAAARLDVEKAKGDLAIAYQERDVAVARLQRAQSGNSPAVRVENASDRVLVSDRVDSAVQEARFGIGSADDRIFWRKCSIEAEERHVELLEARKELAEAKVQQAKCAGLMRADRPEIDAQAMHEIDRSVRRCEVEITVAETRLTAAQKEVDLAKGRAEESIETRREATRVVDERAAALRRAETAREAEAARK